MAVRFSAIRSLLGTTKAFNVIIGFAIVLEACLFVSWAQNSKVFVDATTHQPERYTELYFTQPNSLPSVVSSGKKLAVAFTIHNVDARSISYTYDIDFTSPSGKTKVLLSKGLPLANNATNSTIVSIKLPKFKGRAEIGIVLVHQPESIHFWVVSSS